MKLFHGRPFLISDQPIDSFIFLVEFFELDQTLLKLHPYSFPLPTTLEEALNFLSKSYCVQFPDLCEHSIEIAVSQISQITFEQFQVIQNHALLKIFSSPNIKLLNEDSLFYLLLNLIDEDESKKILLPTIHYPFVSSNLMIQLFTKIFYDDLNPSFFESLKQRLISDISKPNSDIPFNRWNETPKFLSRNEIEQIIIILEKYSQTNERVLEQIYALINENGKFKETITRQNTQIESISKENIELKNQIEKLTKENQRSKEQNERLQT